MHSVSSLFRIPVSFFFCNRKSDRCFMSSLWLPYIYFLLKQNLGKHSLFKTCGGDAPLRKEVCLIFSFFQGYMLFRQRQAINRCFCWRSHRICRSLFGFPGLIATSSRVNHDVCQRASCLILINDACRTRLWRGVMSQEHKICQDWSKTVSYSCS